jgi:pimeloyl-ACP methyl ester carboxylesterase
MGDAEYLSVPTADGRVLEALLSGPLDGGTLLYHSGTPIGAVAFPHLEAATAERGLRLVTYSRPGYGDSTPKKGRAVSDAAADSATVLDFFGLDTFVTLGWSGGGPHALACAALIAPRCMAAATIASVAPYVVDDLDFLAGMGPENLDEFGAAVEGIEPLTAFLEMGRPDLASRTPVDLADSMGGLVSDVDRAALSGPLAEHLAAGLGRSVLRGIEGWRDDDLAFTTPWGFDPEDITVPVSVWQGEHDRMVPLSHGKWLAAHLPTARPHLESTHGHISLAAQLDVILDDLLSLSSMA